MAELPANDGVNNKVVMADGRVGWTDDGGVPRTRFGWGALRDLGRQMCRIVTSFGGLIRRSFGDNPTIILLIDVIDILCPLVEGVSEPLSDGNDIPNQSALFSDALNALQALIDKNGGATA